MRRELLSLFVQSAGDYLDSWFESAPIKAAYGFDGIVGNYASPYSAGSAYVLLHHVFGEVNGKKGAWGHAIGGMGAITQAMAKAAAARGVDIRIASPVREILVEGGRAVGVVTAGWRGDPGAQRRIQLESEAAVRVAHRPRGAAAGFSRAHQPLALRLRDVSHERRAVGAARLHGAAGADGCRSSHRRHHHGAEPGLHGTGVSRCQGRRLVEAAHRRNADSVHSRRQSGAGRPARGQPVLPARGADPAGR